MITIDPNLRGCGVAIWHSGALVRAEYVKNPVASGRGYNAHVALGRAVWQALNGNPLTDAPPCIIEHPRVYPGMPKTDLNDLLDVVAVGAAVAGFFQDAQTVFPSEWKGQLNKKVMLERIASKLTREELIVVQKTNKSDTEDILDAVGIGLWKLGRLSTKVFPGAIR